MKAPDVSNQSQLSVVFRYACSDGDVCERFLKFVHVSEARSSGLLSEILFSVLKEFHCGNKLIAQTYDGAAVMRGHQKGLQKLKDKYQDAIFVHCYAIDSIWFYSNQWGILKSVNYFFKHYQGLLRFFKIV
ncbi:hypothetical protein WA026_002320 [Henosepilachna vigintioctopunctata]|uniref:DUF4371 domain-containing protein n=1 Tax=Henosepilachna vigintioctopunctata TaxID=420089 RepID=A0AAW1U033_9CUCU